MKKFEYKIVFKKTSGMNEDELNEQSYGGWELITILKSDSMCVHYFKRELNEDN